MKMRIKRKQFWCLHEILMRSHMRKVKPPPGFRWVKSQLILIKKN